MGNPVTWFEVHTPDPDQTAAFYSELYGWSTESIPEPKYITFDTHAGGGINGGLGQTREGQPPSSLFFVEDPDIQKVLEKAESLGATTVMGVTEVPDIVTFAMFTDPFGNTVGLVQGDGSTRVSEGDNAPVDWFELTCAEPEKAWNFYGTLFAWKIEGSTAPGGFAYGQVDSGGGIRGGIGGSRDGQPHCTLYAAVDDLQKYLERAESLGATAVMQPTKVDEHTAIALFADPQGVTFGMYHYEEH